jgi:GT2 family glycosyltransferase
VAPLDLSVIIVSHGHESFLPGCIGSLAPSLVGLSAELILVDNLGRGGMAVAAGLSPVPVTTLANSVPCGLANNVNRAVAGARGRFLLILNPDTRWHSGTWREAIGFLDGHERVGLLGARLLNTDGTMQSSVRRFPSVAVPVLRALAVDRWPMRPRFYRELVMDSTPADGPIEVDWAFGACLLLSRHLYQRLGGMDAGFRLYYEDVDLCYRIHELGLAVVLYPGVTLYHDHQRTSARRPLSAQWRWHVASAARFFRKHRYLFRPAATTSGFAPASMPGRPR